MRPFTEEFLCVAQSRLGKFIWSHSLVNDKSSLIFCLTLAFCVSGVERPKDLLPRGSLPNIKPQQAKEDLKVGAIVSFL